MATSNSVSVAGERTRLAAGSAIRKKKSLWRGDMLIAMLVLTPSIIAVALFIYSFIGWTFYISTVKWNSVIIDYTYVGLKNWQRLFQDDRFYTDLRNLVYYAVGFMTQCIVFGFVIAALLDQKIKGETFFRTLIIFPFAGAGCYSRRLGSTCYLPRLALRIFTRSGSQTRSMACGRSRFRRPGSLQAM